MNATPILVGAIGLGIVAYVLKTQSDNALRAVQQGQLAAPIMVLRQGSAPTPPTISAPKPSTAELIKGFAPGVNSLMSGFGSWLSQPSGPIPVATNTGTVVTVAPSPAPTQQATVGGLTPGLISPTGGPGAGFDPSFLAAIQEQTPQQVATVPGPPQTLGWQNPFGMPQQFDKLQGPKR